MDADELPLEVDEVAMVVAELWPSELWPELWVDKRNHGCEHTRLRKPNEVLCTYTEQASARYISVQ